MIITKKFEVLGYAGLCWPSLAVLAFMALDDFFKQKMAFADKIDMFPKIRCQNQLPNEFHQPESLCKGALLGFEREGTKYTLMLQNCVGYNLFP